MELIYRGAEADLMLGRWAGTPAVYKFRKSLPYRLPELDKTIRTQRTIHEAQMIHQARRAGVRTPYLFYVGQAEALLVMEHVSGERLKQALTGNGGKNLSYMVSFGKVVGQMHRAGIMHGDLTTSNVIVTRDKMVVIDFGISVFSKKVEDHAVDLRLIKETLNGAHSAISIRAFTLFLDGYGETVGDAKLTAVKRKLAEIERRGRYARVE